LTHGLLGGRSDSLHETASFNFSTVLAFSWATANEPAIKKLMSESKNKFIAITSSWRRTYSPPPEVVKVIFPHSSRRIRSQPVASRLRTIGCF
jgi:mannose/fructose/N-acetylgalactosamine-specific phosphotransferase system component IID